MKWQKEQIECLVSRLPAREAIKDRLREELWGHLASIYEEELAGADSSDSPRLAACQRFGTATEIRSEFIGALSFHERIEGSIARHIAPVGVVNIRARASRDAFKLFASTTLGLLVLILVTIGLPGMTPISSFFAWLSGTMALALAAISIGIVIHEVHMRTVLRRKAFEQGHQYQARPERIFACASLSLSVMLLAWLAGYTVSLAACAYLDQPEMMRTMEVFGCEALLPASVILSLLSPAFAWGFEWQEYRARRLADWPYLDRS